MSKQFKKRNNSFSWRKTIHLVCLNDIRALKSSFPWSECDLSPIREVSTYLGRVWVNRNCTLPNYIPTFFDEIGWDIFLFMIQSRLLGQPMHASIIFFTADFILQKEDSFCLNWHKVNVWHAFMLINEQIVHTYLKWDNMKCRTFKV